MYVHVCMCTTRVDICIYVCIHIECRWGASGCLGHGDRRFHLIPKALEGNI